jgi:hypothetical protein
MTGWGGHGNAMYLGITFSCVPLRIPHVQGTDDSVRVRAHGILVPSTEGKACGIADGTWARRLDVVVHGRGAHLRRGRLATSE